MGRLAVLIFTGVIFAVTGTAALAGDHDTEETTYLRPLADEANKEDWIKAVKEAGKTVTFWENSHKLFDVWNRKQAGEWLTDKSELDENGWQYKWFQFAIQARWESDVKKLRKWAEHGTEPEGKRLAAVHELRRRLNDPLVRFIREQFGLPPETAIEFAAKLEKWAGDPVDPRKAATALAKLMGTRTQSQQDRVKAIAEAELKRIDGKEGDEQARYGSYAKVLKWMNSAVDTVRDPGSAKGDFATQFKSDWETIKKQNDEFHQYVLKAKSGDKGARDWLFKNYDHQTVLTFIGDQLKNGNDGVAVDTAWAFGEKKGDTLVMHLSPANSFTKEGRNQTVLLADVGEDKKAMAEQIRASLSAIQHHTAFDHDSDLFPNGAENPFEGNGFHRYSVAPVAGQKPARFQAAETGDGHRFSEEPVEGKWGTPSREPVVRTNPAVFEAPGEDKPVVTTTSGLSDEAAVKIITAQCGSCHVDKTNGGFRITPETLAGSKASLSAILDAMYRDTRSGSHPQGKARKSNVMPDGYDSENNTTFRETPDGKALVKWLMDKTSSTTLGQDVVARTPALKAP